MKKLKDKGQTNRFDPNPTEPDPNLNPTYTALPSSSLSKSHTLIAHPVVHTSTYVLVINGTSVNRGFGTRGAKDVESAEGNERQNRSGLGCGGS